MPSDRLTIGNAGATRFGSPKKGLPAIRKRDGSQPIYGRVTYEEGADSAHNVEFQARLLSEALGTPNLAGTGNEDLIERARAVVLDGLKDQHNVVEFLRNKFLIEYRLYRGETVAQHHYGRLQLHSPEPYKAVESLHPRLMQALFDQPQWFRLRGEEDQHDAAAKAQEALCTQQFSDMRYMRHAEQMIRNLCIYGTCIQKTFWHQDTREVAYAKAQRVPDENRIGQTKIVRRKVEREEMVFDGNKVREVSIFDFFAPPASDDIQDSEWSADRSLWGGYDIVKMGQLQDWANLKELRDHPGSNDQTYGDEYKERKAYSYGLYDPRAGGIAPHIPHYEVIDWWGMFDIEGNGVEVPCNITMIEPESRKTIAVVRRNPFWHGKKPYQVCRYTGLQEELYGIGAIEPIARLSAELDNNRNLYGATVALLGNPMLVAEDQANVPDGQLIAQPGLVLRAATADGIKPLFLPKVDDVLLRSMSDLKQEIRETHGVTAALMGVSASDSRGTATEYTGDIKESNMRILSVVKNFERDILEPMLEQMTMNNQQFMSRPRVINTIGPQGLKWKDRFMVNPLQIIGNFIVQPVASTRLSRMLVQNQQLINLLDRAPALNMQYGREVVKIPALLAKIFREGFGFQDVADFIEVDPKDMGLLSSMEEHEMWVHGQVPPTRLQDNHIHHFEDHKQFLEGPDGERLRTDDPATYNEAQAHTAEHGREIAKMQEDMENILMKAEQQRAVSGQGGDEAGRGFAGATQDQESPNFRPESGMPRSEDGAAKSEGSQGAPNPGGS